MQLHLHPARLTDRRAFTLVELSIVLVVIGLLVGGVLAGQSLVRSAAIRSVPVQGQKFIAAGQSFLSEFNALPGDIKNASTYWGAADGSTGSTAGCKTTASGTETTCNGNGDGYLLPITASVEGFRFWQHLVNAGLIEGKFDGITHGSNDISATTVNSPVGKLSNSAWFTYYNGYQAGDASTLFQFQYDNYLLFGGITANNYPAAGIMSPEEMSSIDTKIDDGKPGSGSLIAVNHAACTLSTSATDFNAEYELLTKTNECVLLWPRAFRVN